MRTSDLVLVAIRSCVIALALVECTQPYRIDDAATTHDAGRVDAAATMDAGASDSAIGTADAGPPDVGAVDVGPPDSSDDVGADGGYVLYHGWTSPIAGCSTTSFDSTTATALGGMYPYNAGDDNSCRAWKLAATVCTTEPMMYSDQTNWTCPASGGFTDPMFGTYCMGTGVQYACSTCPGLCNATCSFVPLSLRNCAGVETRQN